MRMRGRHSGKIALLILLVFLIILARVAGISAYLSFDSLNRNKYILENFVRERYFFSVALYIAAYVIVTALSIPGATVLTLLGGFLFGVLLGAIYTNAGATIGAAIAFLFARYIIGEWVQKKYKDRLQRFNDEMSRNGHAYLLTLRLIPAFPFFLINFFAGLTNIPIRTFIWTTALGIIPGSMVYSFAGSQLHAIKSADDILSLKMILSLSLLWLLILFPVIFKKIKERKQT